MISVIVPTHNGAQTLPFLMDALLAIDMPKGGYEIIAVDNASTDSTSDILARYAESLPLIVLAEPRKGKSYALNTAIQHARGEYVVFTDDDVVPAFSWLTEFESAAQSFPAFDLFAGQVRHKFLGTPPHWLVRLCEEGLSYGGTPVDRRDGPLSGADFKGANFMVSRAVLDTIQFSVDGNFNFGQAGHAVGGEDTDFVIRSIEQGFKARYVSAAMVAHIVRKNQISLIAVGKRYFRIGRASVRVSSDNSNTSNQLPTIFGYPRYLFKKIPLLLLRATVYLARNKPYDAAVLIINLAMETGRNYELKRRLEL